MGRIAGAVFILGGCLGLTHAWAAERDLRDRWPHEREKGSYQARIASSGKVLWTVHWKTKVTEQVGQKQIEVEEEGEGQPWRYREPIQWKKRMVFDSPLFLHSGGDGISPVSVRSVKGSRWTQQGKLLSEMEMAFDPIGQRLFFKDGPAGKDRESAVFTQPGQLLPDELLFHWARTLPFDQSGGGGVAECLLLISPKRQFRIQAQVQGIETIQTPAGIFPCYKVELTPQLFGPLKVLAPKMALWCATQPPHHWVRYRGPVGGPGSPEAVIELVEYRGE